MPQNLFLSIILAVDDLARVTARALRSLTPAYQNIPAERYEVIVVHHGATPSVDAETLTALSPNFRYLHLENAAPSSVHAINIGARAGTGNVLGIITDGTHILSPGVLTYAFRALRAYENPIICPPGYELHTDADATNWSGNGYRLFDNAAPGSHDGWFASAAASGCVFLHRKTYFNQLNGYDETFSRADVAHLDFLRRACDLPDAQPVTITGEGAFQVGSANTFTDLAAHYREATARDLSLPDRAPESIGRLPLKEANAAFTAPTPLIFTPSTISPR